MLILKYTSSTHTLTVTLAEGADVVNVKTMPSMGYREHHMLIEEILFNPRNKMLGGKKKSSKLVNLFM